MQAGGREFDTPQVHQSWSRKVDVQVVAVSLERGFTLQVASLRKRAIGKLGSDTGKPVNGEVGSAYKAGIAELVLPDGSG